MTLRRILFAAFIATLTLGAVAAVSFAADEPPPLIPDPENTVDMDLTYGRVVIRLHPDLAPNTVARFKELVRQGFYDGLSWHRVIAGFMAQTGDPTGTGMGGSGQILAAEFNSGRHVRGAISMARSSDANSADSQFFIVTGDATRLDGKYTYFGNVVSGMEFVDQIRKGDPNQNGQVAYPDHIVHMKVEADPDNMPRATAAPAAGGNQRNAPAATPVPALAAKFDGASMTCMGYINGLADTGSAGISTAFGHIWLNGYLAGYYKARSLLAIATAPADRSAFDGLLADNCRSIPKASLRAVAMNAIGKEQRPVPDAAFADFSVATTTCAQYTAAKSNPGGGSELADLWAFAFIQGYKNAGQKDMVISMENRPILAAAIGKGCASNPTSTYADLVTILATKVKLESK